MFRLIKRLFCNHHSRTVLQFVEIDGVKKKKLRCNKCGKIWLEEI